MYKFFFKPLFFLFDAEKVHLTVFSLLNIFYHIPGIPWILRKTYQVRDQGLQKEVFGVKFKNPVGLAAGFDKDARLVECLDALGFGFIEIGTLTPRPQAGNPTPRLFRLPADEALINRMGFNNEGVLEAVKRLKWKNPNIIVGGNIGKNKDTPNDRAVEDYEYCFEALYDHVDYFVVNVSSPNTPNLRELQEKEPLKALLSRLKERSSEKGASKPILLKIAPDLTSEQLNDIVEIVLEVELDGLIATNTTISRDGLTTDPGKVESIGNGGLSGQPLKSRANEVIRYLRSRLGDDFPIIGVGGLASAADVKERLEAGADLVQIYTGFIYEGPGLIKRFNQSLLQGRSE